MDRPIHFIFDENPRKEGFVYKRNYIQATNITFFNVKSKRSVRKRAEKVLSSVFSSGFNLLLIMATDDMEISSTSRFEHWFELLFKLKDEIAIRNLRIETDFVHPFLKYLFNMNFTNIEYKVKTKYFHEMLHIANKFEFWRHVKANQTLDIKISGEVTQELSIEKHGNDISLFTNARDLYVEHRPYFLKLYPRLLHLPFETKLHFHADWPIHHKSKRILGLMFHWSLNKNVILNLPLDTLNEESHILLWLQRRRRQNQFPIRFRLTYLNSPLDFHSVYHYLVSDGTISPNDKEFVSTLESLQQGMDYFESEKSRNGLVLQLVRYFGEKNWMNYSTKHEKVLKNMRPLWKRESEQMLKQKLREFYVKDKIRHKRKQNMSNLMDFVAYVQFLIANRK